MKKRKPKCRHCVRGILTTEDREGCRTSGPCHYCKPRPKPKPDLAERIIAELKKAKRQDWEIEGGAIPVRDVNRIVRRHAGGKP